MIQILYRRNLSLAIACSDGMHRVRGDTSVSVRRPHIGQFVISAVSFQVRWRPVTDIRFAFETPNTIMTLRLSGLLLKDPRSHGQECAEEFHNTC